MSRVVKLQTNFTVGEINPELRGRVDLQQYESALERARNVIINPRGTVDRRPGLKFIFEIPSAAQPENGVRLCPFTFSTTQAYSLLFTAAGRMYVFRSSGTQVTGINGTSDDFLDVSSSATNVTDGINAARLGDLWWTQSADTLLLFQETMTPLKIVRGAGHQNWTVTDLAFDEIPRYLFTPSETLPAANLTPSQTDGRIDLTASAATFHDGLTGTATAGGTNTITLPSSAVATDDIYNGSKITLTGGTGSGQAVIIEDYVGSSRVATVAANWATQPDATSTFTIPSHVGQKIFDNDSGIGQARIVDFESSTVVKAVTETPFFNTDAMGNYTLQQGWENAWSPDRGWPRSATFHEGRLMIGGSQSLPTTVWGSKVGFFFDFNKGTGLDDESVEATLDTDQVNAVTGVISGRLFQVFTTNTEWALPQLDGEPVTPSSFLFKEGTRRGSKTGVRPLTTEGGTIFLQRGGRSIREFIFNDLEGSFVSNDISLLSSHLLVSPTRIVMRKGTSVDEGDLMMVVNNDGSVAAFSILRSQNVVAPSLLTTNGNIKDISVEDNDDPTIYAVVERTINSATKYYVEIFDSNFTTDSAKQVTPPAYGTTLVNGASQSGTTLIVDGLTVQPQAGDKFTIAGVSGTYTINSATTLTTQTTTHTVTVSDPGSGNKFFINGVQQPTLELIEGNTYIFNYPSAHPFRFSTTSDGTHGGGSEFTSGVTHNSSTQLTFVVPSGAPTLFYFCANHSGMGGQANTPATSAALEQSTLTLSTSLASSPADNAVVTFTTVSKIDTLSHLEGSVCKVIADDRMLADETVASGSVTIDAPASTYVEVGLEYPTFTDPLVDNAVKTTPLIRTMPVETRLSSGPVTGFRKRIIRASALLDDTQNLTINNDQVAFRRLDVDNLDSGVAFFTGTKRAGPFLGYDFEGQIEVTQSAPLFFTLLALDYQVSVGQ